MIDSIFIFFLILYFIFPLNKKYGLQISCSLYILMIFLIPNGIITLPGGISFNRTILSFYLLVVVIFKEKKLDLGISKYVFFYYISLLLVIFLTSDEVPISFQLKTFIRSFVADGVLLYVLYYTTIKHTNAYVFFSWTIIILILITTIYGFFNASFLGSKLVFTTDCYSISCM